MTVSQHTTGVIAVVVVLGSLLGLGVWGALARPSTPAVREPGAPAVSGAPTGPGPSTEPGGGGPTASVPAGSPGGAVDWAAVSYPLDCQGLRVLVVRVVTVSVAGRASLDVVEVRCDAGAGSPPSEVLAYLPPAGGTAAPRLVATLVDVSADVLVTSVTAADDRVVVSGTSYSAPSVPRCCPDRTYRASWTWSGSALERSRSG